MASGGIDLVLIAPSADMVYFAAYAGHASERPTLLAIGGDAAPWMAVPMLEAPRVPDADSVRLLAYEETEDPIVRLRQVLAPSSGVRVAISDTAWASVLLRLQAAFPDGRFIPASPLIRELRMMKAEEELAHLRRAGALADAAFADVIQQRFAGRREREIAEELNALLRARGLRTSGHLPIVASGPNSASPHHLTGDREIHEGDAVVLDFGGTVEGYYADITRTVHVGTPDDEFRHVYLVVKQAQEAGVRAVAPGVEAQKVDAVTRGVIAAAGYADFFIHRTGHGIGLEGHEEPYIVAGNALALAPGMTFSVEPGIYLPGRFGVRIEDIVAVTAAGAESLNQASHELVIVH
jgi:D-alanyl-D-alanine dipeptidase